MLNFKKNWGKFAFLSANVLITLLFFFIPCLSFRVYYDNVFEGEYFFNFYELISFNESSLRTWLSIITVFLFLILFVYVVLLIIDIIDSYKLILYKNILSNVLQICSIMHFVLSLTYLILTICYVNASGGEYLTFIQTYYFHAGSVLLVIFSLTMLICSTILRRRKKL